MDSIFEAIKQDPQNADFTARGIDPLYTAPKTARIVIVGQAPGAKAEAKRRYWDDPSGDRLRDWMGIDRETFYQSDKLAILPLDFYFPGHGKSGDLPPRKGFADKWHPKLLATMPHVELFVLVGSYAQKYYLKDKAQRTLTATVQDFAIYLPTYFPLVHPSPRNQIWMSKNPWFEADVLPVFKQTIADILKK
ncbi:uracil-DNA glycosylase family protein [Streptococcus sp. DD12]|uniref:uracil-DNA glycosylase family protein n=1 Tax=Streptococcus sp. DD12 TaxID=1777880 RepID=UPI000797DCF0|nr:uracil-DNA glycosylase family protein [Streptococcus sp. DD12]KXT76019.1 hypothetical protein STRDD12_01131 [Streptococcus sp. DD12]